MHIVVGCVLARYIISLRWKIAKKMLSPLDTLFTTKYYKQLLVESLLLLIAPYPGLEETTYTESYVDKGVTV